MVVKATSLENLNTMVLTEKLGEFIKESNVKAVSDKCRLVRMTLSQKIHHFPVNIPFIAAVMECEEGKQAVFFIKRKKFAMIEGGAVSSSKNVGDSFEIDKIKYVLEDTINGMARYKPVFPKSEKARRKPVKVEN